MNVAIIPARGGSKRIPKKNIKDFLGKPIIAYSIEAAISTNLFDKVIVSTDSDEIAEVAINYGAEAPFLRPKELADDFTGNHKVMRHAINWLENTTGKINYTCCIYPAAPLIEEVCDQAQIFLEKARSVQRRIDFKALPVLLLATLADRYLAEMKAAEYQIYDPRLMRQRPSVARLWWNAWRKRY